MKVTKIKYYLLLIIIIGCANQDTNFIEIEQFNNNGSYLNIDNFKNTGFKVLKEYDVSGLENADSAFFGWMKDELNNTYDYELRFYDTHDNAINSVEIIEEIMAKQPSQTKVKKKEKSE